MRNIFKKLREESLRFFLFFLPWFSPLAYLIFIFSIWEGIKKINFRKISRSKLSFFDYALISFFLAVSLSVIFSTFKPLSLGAFVLFILYLTLCLLTRGAARSKEGSSNLLQWFFYSGLVVIFFGIFQYLLKIKIDINYSFFTLRMRTDAGITSTLGNPNRLAKFLILLLPLSLTSFFSQKRRGKIIPGILLGAGFPLLFLTKSVGGMGALIMVILIFFLLKNWKIGIIILVLFTFLFFLNYNLILEFIGKNSSLEQRIEGWKNIAFPLMKDHLILGSGLATYPKVSSYYQSFPEGLYSHAHSIYINYLCEIGLLGAGTLFLCVGIFIKKCLTLFYKKSFFVARGTLGGCFLAILAALIYGTVETFIDYFQLGLLFWGIIGMGMGIIEKVSSGVRS